MFCWAQDAIFVLNMCDLLQLCRFTADIFDVNTFPRTCQLSETKLDKVCQHTRLPDTLDTGVILEGLSGLITVIVRETLLALSALI